MEANLIYIKSRYLLGGVDWLNPTFDNGAWVYIGCGEDTQRELALKRINEYFNDNFLYIAHTKKDSFLVEREIIDKAIDHILGLGDFIIWNEEFKKVIEFNKLGGMRYGKLGS